MKIIPDADLYTCTADLLSGEIERHHSKEEDYSVFDSEEEADEYGDGGAGYATFEDDYTIYAESVISQEDADRLVLARCEELYRMLEVIRKKFNEV